MSTRPSRSLPAALGLAVVACACSPSTGAGSDGAVQVTAGYYPLAWVAERVAGDRAEVTNLTNAGQDPHSAEPTIRQTGAVASADLVLLTADLQASVAESVQQNAGGAVLDTRDVVELRPVTTHEHDDAGEDHPAEDHADEGHADGDQADEDHADEDHADGDQADEDHHEGDGHDHGDLDPHFWLDPLLMAQVGDAVADALAEVDPDGAEEYAEGAAELREELERLDRDYTEQLSTCERDTVVVSHDAFGYLSRYGLHFEPIAGLSPGAEPSPAHLQRLQRLAVSDGVTTVFTESLASPALAESLAGDLGLRTDVLDPLEGLTDETADEDYLSLSRANLAALVEANGC